MNFKLHKMANIILGIERTSIKSTVYKLRIISDGRPSRLEGEPNNVYYYKEEDGSYYFDVEAGTYNLVVYDYDGTVYYTQPIMVTTEMYNTMDSIDVRKGDE